MAASVTVFYNFTPNTDGGARIFPAVGSLSETYDYSAEILDYYKQQTNNYELLTGVTYEIFNNYIEVGITNKSVGDFRYNITYIAIQFETKTIFYFVDKVEFIETGMRCYTRPDNWSSYIGQARINHLKFRRTNVKLEFEDTPISRPIYYTQKLSIDMGARSFLGAFTGQERGRTIGREKLRIYATIKYRTYSDITKTIEQIDTYEFNPNDIISTATPTAQDIYNFIDLIASIYGVGGGVNALTAEIMHMYILQEGIIKTGSFLTRFNGLLRGEDKEVLGRKILTGINNEDIKLYNTREGGATVPLGAIKISQLGKDIYFGTKYNGLKLPYFVGEFTIRFTVFSNKDNLTFMVMAGEEIKDITSSFEITAIANTGSLVGIQAAAKWLGIIANTAGGAFQIASGGAGLVSGTAQIANTMLGIPNNNNGTYIGGGDGLTTFDDIINNNYDDYLYLTVYSSQTSGAYGEAIINNYGAECNYIATDTSKDLKSFLSNMTSLIDYTVFDYFIECECAVNNVPYEAAAEIQNIFNEGVQLIIK